MKTYTVKFEQKLPISLEQAWDFFSSPLNLAKITPKKMAFIITSDYTAGQKMYQGMIITYKVAPLLGIKIDWMTEITHVKDGEYFIDEQRFGPYKLWHHRHSFKKTATGVEMNDEVNYVLPFGILGQIAHALFIRRRVEEIFTYRTKVVDDFFRK